MGAPETIIIFVIFSHFFILGYLGYRLGKTRNIGSTAGMLLGLFFSLLGLLIVLLSSKKNVPMQFFGSPAEELKKYKDLYDNGIISEVEFNQQKAKILSVQS